MTESSTLTVYQLLFNKLGTKDPDMACLKILERVEKLEDLVIDPEVIKELQKPRVIDPNDPLPGNSSCATEPKRRGGRPKGSKNKE